MVAVRLADFNVHIENKYEYLKNMCENYESSGAPDFTITVSDNEIAREGGAGHKAGYLESLAVYRKLSEILPHYGAFLMHGAVIDVDGTGVAFLALSGTGKTTHMMNWRALLGERVTVVNGDKPLIRITDGGVFAYGTPWSGKEGLNSNIRTPLKKICFIERSETNECIPMTDGQLKRLLMQTYRPSDMEAYFKTIDMLGTIIESAEFYIIRCNMDITSAEIAYRTIIK